MMTVLADAESLNVSSNSPVLVSQTLTAPSIGNDIRSLQFTKKATALTEYEWASSVCRTAPDPASHSLVVPSLDADASSLPSGEKATVLMQLEWLSSVCSTAFHFSSTLGNFRIYLGLQFSNCLLIMLVVGVNIRALQYV
jgi:hypothetical protein